jgi:glycosyltransferase involved in cell wall biosynthesis
MQIDLTAKCGGERTRGVFKEGSASQPLVTVVTAVYNGCRYIRGCLESVLRQDYPNIEHIVLDGGSGDGTVEVLKQFDDRIALWKSERDGGVYAAWNKALLEARGDWICFLGVDDEFLPGAIGAYMNLAAKNPRSEYLSSRVKWVYPSGHQRIIGRPWSWRDFSKYMCTAHVGSMHRRSLFDRLGEFDASYRIAGDYEFLLRAGRQLDAGYMPVITVMMRTGGLSDSNKAIEEAARAKVTTGGRNQALTAIELQVEKVKYKLRPLRHVLQRKTVQVD